MTDEAATDDAVINEVAELIHQAGEAHHHAYHETDGVDPEWALVLGLAPSAPGRPAGPGPDPERAVLPAGAGGPGVRRGGRLVAEIRQDAHRASLTSK